MKKGLIFLCFVFAFSVCAFSQNTRTFTIEITNVVVNNGNIIIAVFGSAEEFRNETPTQAFSLPSTATAVRQEVTLPYGEYLITSFQDANGNNDMDFNFLGIPKEILGMTNWNGRGFPSRNFDRHKVPVNASTTVISIGLFKI